MKFLLIALGSAGDVHPFVGLGKRLAERGHTVTVLANEVFGDTVCDAGLTFGELGDAATYRILTDDPDIWHPRRGPQKVFQETVQRIPEMIEAIEEHLSEDPADDTVMVGSSLALGARLLQERDGRPLVTVHLQPSVILSAEEPPLLPGAPIRPWTPVWWNRAALNLGLKVLGRFVNGPIDEVRRGMGLPPQSEPLLTWWSSPERVIGLFPPWYARLAPDWPRQVVLTGFPLWDESDQRPVDDDLERWLAAGEPPVVLTPGSANFHAAEFFADGIEACRRLGRRGLLLTGDRAHLPDPLPDGFLHREFVPFSRAFPRAAVVIHHGGVGTVAQALAAGVPQIVAAFSHDQFDNGARVEALGVGRWFPPARRSADRFEAALRDLLDPGVARAAALVARRVRETDGLGETCEVLERYAAAKKPGAPAPV